MGAKSRQRSGCPILATPLVARVGFRKAQSKEGTGLLHLPMRPKPPHIQRALHRILRREAQIIASRP